MEEDDFTEFDDSDADKDYIPDDFHSENNDEYAYDQNLTENEESMEYEQSNLAEGNSTKVSSKKRLRNPNKHKREENKWLKNSGKGYIGHRNQPKQEKKFLYYRHTCRYKCTKMSEEECKHIFTAFWELGNWNLQSSFIASCIKIEKPSRLKTDASTHKNKSVVITLKNNRVCKDFFLKTLSISNGRYSRVVARKSESGFAGTDKRGKQPNPHKISDEVRNLIRDHINLFPKYRSHYTRRDNLNKKYLPSYINLKKMYTCYIEFCAAKQRTPAKEWLYRHIFNTEFNLSFHQPHSDTCSKCDQFDIKIKATEDAEQKRTIEIEREVHQRKAEKAVKAKANAKNIAKNSDNNNTVSFCFDLQKTLPTPSPPNLTTNKVFYMRVLWTYNFGIHNLANGDGYMYVWDEATASRGSCEIASCLLKYIQQLPNTTKHLIAFSDSCGGQNKNKNIVKF